MQISSVGKGKALIVLYCKICGSSVSLVKPMDDVIGEPVNQPSEYTCPCCDQSVTQDMQGKGL